MCDISLSGINVDFISSFLHQLLDFHRRMLDCSAPLVYIAFVVASAAAEICPKRLDSSANC